jgi:hypothetical protein
VVLNSPLGIRRLAALQLRQLAKLQAIRRASSREQMRGDAPAGPGSMLAAPALTDYSDSRGYETAMLAGSRPPRMPFVRAVRARP